jgi:hypothetical protein
VLEPPSAFKSATSTASGAMRSTDSRSTASMRGATTTRRSAMTTNSPLIPSSRNKTSSTSAASIASASTLRNAAESARVESNTFALALDVIHRGNDGVNDVESATVVLWLPLGRAETVDIVADVPVGLRATGVVNASSCLRARGERR